MRDLKQELFSQTLSNSWPTETIIISYCCVKPLLFVVVCCIIDNWNGNSPWQSWAPDPLPQSLLFLVFLHPPLPILVSYQHNIQVILLKCILNLVSIAQNPPNFPIFPTVKAKILTKTYIALHDLPFHYFSFCIPIKLSLSQSTLVTWASLLLFKCNKHSLVLGPLLAVPFAQMTVLLPHFLMVTLLVRPSLPSLPKISTSQPDSILLPVLFSS